METFADLTSVFGNCGVFADPGTMKKYIKKADLILILTLIVLSIASMFLLRSEEGNTIIIKQNHNIIYQGKLSENAVIPVEGAYQNEICVENGTVYMKKSNCPGGDCLLQGSISHSGEHIACLPNGVIVFITGEKKSEVDVVAG